MPDTSEFLPVDQKVPLLGLNTLTPTDQMAPQFSPNSLNMIFDNFIAEKRGGYGTLGRSLNGVIQDIFDFEDSSGVNHFIAVTTTGIWEFDFTIDNWFLKSKLGANVVPDYGDCEDKDLWTAGSNVTLTDNAVAPPVGSNSMKIAIGPAASAGQQLAFSDEISPALDITSYGHISFWLHSSIALAANTFSVGLTEANDGTTDFDPSVVFIVNQAIPATTWTRVRLYPDIPGSFLNVDAALTWTVDLIIDIEADISIDDLRLCTDLEGDVGIPVDRAAATDTDDGRLLFVTNGVDIVQFWDGSGFFADISDMDNWSGGDDTGINNFVKCDTIELFKDHLFFGNVETSADNPHSVVWSVAGDFDNFTTKGSGTMLLSDAQGEIIKLLRLADRLAVYTEGSIHLITYLGEVLLFGQEKKISNFSILSLRSVVDLGSTHVVLSQDDLYAFDGSRNMIRLSERVSPTIRGNINLEFASQAYLFVHTVRQRLYAAIPTATGENKILLFHYDINDSGKSRWTLLEYNDDPLAMGTYIRNSALKWNSASIAGVTWEGMDKAWDETEGDQGFPVRVLASGDQVYETDLTLQDNVVDVTGVYESPDYSSPAFESFICRWLEMEITAQGAEVLVQTSVDKGLTYSVGETLTLDPNNMLRYRLLIDVSGRTFRIKMSGFNFKFNWSRVWFYPVSER